MSKPVVGGERFLNTITSHVTSHQEHMIAGIKEHYRLLLHFTENNVSIISVIVGTWDLQDVPMVTGRRGQVLWDHMTRGSNGGRQDLLPLLLIHLLMFGKVVHHQCILDLQACGSHAHPSLPTCLLLLLGNHGKVQVLLPASLHLMTLIGIHPLLSLHHHHQYHQYRTLTFQQESWLPWYLCMSTTIVP